MKRGMWSFADCLALMATMLAFSGCHTLEGAAQDLEAAGEAVGDAVR